MSDGGVRLSASLTTAVVSGQTCPLSKQFAVEIDFAAAVIGTLDLTMSQMDLAAVSVVGFFRTLCPG